MGKFFGGLAIATAALCAAAPAQATSFVFSGNTNTSGANNSYTPAAVGGLSVTATAWSVSGMGASNTPTQGYVGVFGNGLGATTSGESGGGTTHTVDNVGNYDFIRLVFSSAVRLTGFTLTGFSVNGAADSDAWVSFGTGTNAFNTNSLWGGYIDRGAEVLSGTSASYSSTNFSNVWLIGAARSSASSARNDGFKLGTVNVVAVPEPATWLTMILGFGLMGSALRRRVRTTARIAFA